MRGIMWRSILGIPRISFFFVCVFSASLQTATGYWIITLCAFGVCYIVAICLIRSSFNCKYTLFALQLYTQSKRWIEIEPLIANIYFFFVRSLSILPAFLCSLFHSSPIVFGMTARIHFGWIGDIERNAAHFIEREIHAHTHSNTVSIALSASLYLRFRFHADGLCRTFTALLFMNYDL